MPSAWLLRLTGGATAVLLALSACGSDDGDRAADPTTTVADGPTGELTVLAAASLTDAFTELGAEFEATHPGSRITFSFGASSALREQVLAGAPADLFASANQANLDQVIAGGEATDSEVLATNVLEIAVPTGNPAGISGLADFAEPELLLGLCAEEVPCGQFARQALAQAGVTPSVDTNAPDVRALLTQVATGDLDAGIVYATDVLAAEDTVDGVEIPPADNVEARYPIALLTGSANPELAQAFLDFVTSPSGREILLRFGFGAP